MAIAIQQSPTTCELGLSSVDSAKAYQEQLKHRFLARSSANGLNFWEVEDRAVNHILLLAQIPGKRQPTRLPPLQAGKLIIETKCSGSCVW